MYRSQKGVYVLLVAQILIAGTLNTERMIRQEMYNSHTSHKLPIVT
jgi:hypothetical protein